MERIQRLADLSVRRACGFALLAIGTMLIGFSYQLAMFAKLGAILFSLQAAVLLAFARRRYKGRAHRRTELWTLLGGDPGLDLPEDRIREILAGALREAYMRYFTITVWAAGAFWIMTVIAWLAALLR